MTLNTPSLKKVSYRKVYAPFFNFYLFLPEFFFREQKEILIFLNGIRSLDLRG